MEPGTPLLALKLGELSHALEPGRDYLIGTADDCDLQVPAAAPHQAQLCVVPDGVALVVVATEPRLEVNGQVLDPAQTATVALAEGDRITIGEEIATVVVDDGTAAFVPVPAMRQAAVERRMAAVRTAAAALRNHGEESFQELVAHELRRTPWLLTSLALHVLFLLLLWWLTPEREIGGLSIATLGVDVAAGATLGEGPPAPPEITIEEDEDEIMVDPEPTTPDEPVPVVEGAHPRPNQPPVENVQLAPRQRTHTAGNGRNAILAEDGVGSGSFRKAVAELQESGLELVFVFDSTGSMTRTIFDTKTTIVQMLGVLRTLVPDARVGLITYRDRGRREEYLVRQVPLDLDYWRASNFVQFIVAEGGGDRPEDVRAGLRAAFQQNWNKTARRVVVLAGDAPPHRSDFDELLGEVRRFAQNRRSFVHALITSPGRAGADTEEAFRAIAKAGRGACEPIENHDRVLQRVLTLAFGREFDKDVQDVVQAVEKERNRVDVESLHLVRMGGKHLKRALKQRPVRTTLWNAVVRRPRQETATILVDLLGGANTPSHTRQASAAALQRILELPVPPIDPGSGEPPSPRRLARLRNLAGGLPN